MAQRVSQDAVGVEGSGGGDMSEHTKEPWTRIYDSGIGPSDGFVFQCPLDGLEGEYAQANARRIVACVNACRMLTIEQLESAADGDLGKIMLALPLDQEPMLTWLGKPISHYAIGRPLTK